METLRGHRALSAALAAITAAVVGVIANLALWFALNVLFEQQSRVAMYGVDVMLPVAASVNAPMLALSAVAFALVFVARLGILPVLGICAGLGVAARLLS